MISESISIAFAEIVKLCEVLDVHHINQLPGCWEYQVDEQWRIAVNGHREPMKCSMGFEVAPFHCYVEWGGFPAGEFHPLHGGFIAAGEAANEDTFIEALKLATEKAEAEQSAVFTLDLVAHLTRQRAFSLKTFGPGIRTKGIIEHIKKELVEIEEHPHDLKEWIDVAILAFDGAWRSGAKPEEVARAMEAKQTINEEEREWPDWRTCDANEAIEHIRPDEHPAESEN